MLPRKTFGYAVVEESENKEAGAAIRWEPAPQEEPDVTGPDQVLHTKAIFDLAEWVSDAKLSDGEQDRFFKLEVNKHLPWRDVEEFNETLDALPHGPDWTRQSITVVGDKGWEVCDLWFRDTLDVVRQQIANPRFGPGMRYRSEVHRREDDPGIRVYDEMCSGDWWPRVEALLPKGATVSPSIFATDETKLKQFGRKKAYPVYQTIGNISKSVRRCSSQRAWLLVGYLPMPDLKCISNDEERRKRRWELFHACMKRIVAPLKAAATSGVEMLCADGGVRRVHPLLAAYVADFPEQCTVASTICTRCPICLTEFKGRGELENPARLRTKADTILGFAREAEGNSTYREKVGHRPVRPFWTDFPYASAAEFLAPDLLHQLHKGVLGDHIMSWCNNVLKKEPLDSRFASMPEHSGIRRFRDGISGLTMDTGGEAKEMGKVIVPLIAGSECRELVGAARCLLDFMYRAHRPQLDDNDLEALERDLAEFDDYKSAFGSEGVLDTRDMFDGIPKIHMLRHYIRSIRELGTTDGFNTEAPERLHIDYVKVPYRASSGPGQVEQMLQHLQRREAISMLRAQLEREGVIPEKKVVWRKDGPVLVDLHEDDDGDQPRMGDMVGTEGGAGGAHVAPGIYQFDSPFEIAKRAPRPNVRGSSLIGHEAARHIIPKLHACLDKHVPTHRFIRFDESTQFPVWTRFRIVHEPLPFAPLMGRKIDRIRAYGGSRDCDQRVTRHPTFDTVLLEAFPTKTGLLRYRAARVRVIFKLPSYAQDVYSGHLAYVELFRPFSESSPRPERLHKVSHLTNNGQRVTAVVPLSDIRAACHLAPQYDTLSDTLVLNSSSDLLSDASRFYFNPYSSDFMKAVAEHWQSYA